MTRVDLDAVEVRLGTRYGEVVTFKADEVMAMAAELRAAREALRLAPRPPRVLTDREEHAYLKALAAYDQGGRPMTRVDLDALTPGYWHHGDPDRYKAVIAELRAAREVVKAARWIEQTGALPPSNEIGARRLSDLEQAVRVYEEAVGS